ncbi:MAG: hypothetical protein GQ533_00005 [Methanosarcinaceae archaeon]|nr:hypothetical protein [Methanosarcinaceae archaeon]
MRLLAVRAAGGGRCMMLAAARMFGMEPGGAVTAPAYDSGTPHGTYPMAGRGGVWCACSLSGRGWGLQRWLSY